MNSLIVKHSIVVANHKTSVSLEDAFWRGLKEIALGQDLTLSELIAKIDSERNHANLSSALRLFVLERYRTRPNRVPAEPQRRGLECQSRLPATPLRRAQVSGLRTD